MKYIRKLPTIDELCQDNPLSVEEKNKREKRIIEIQNIISGKDDRKLLIIGPCSADKVESVLEYTLRLAKVSEKVQEKFLIVPRIYTGKPRTTGMGYKGMLHNPAADDEENLMEGVLAARQMHMKVIRETGLFAADEMLYPEEKYYLGDLLAYLAVGARSVEDQGHRMAASDDVIPVGLKNPTAGSKEVLINSIIAAQQPHTLMYRGWEVQTTGNKYAHSILRGFTNKSNKSFANYHYDDLVELYDMCIKSQISNPGVIVDCNHANSSKKYNQQPRIAREVLASCRENSSINTFFKGFMIESYLEDGCQLPGQGVYGKSITDPCLGWEKTERLIYEMADLI